MARAALWAAISGTGVIAACAFFLSYVALADLAARSGVPAGQQWLWPLVVDGIIVVSTIAVFALSGHRGALTIYPWVLLCTGAAVSVVANSTHAVLSQGAQVPPVVAAGVAAVPPLALVCATHLSVLLLRRVAPARSRRERHTAGSVSAVSAGGQHAGERRVSAGEQAPGPRASSEEMQAWYSQQVTAGTTPTGAQFARQFGVSPATGRRRVAQFKEQLTPTA